MTKDLRATCPFCSLHCADLRLSIDEGRLTHLSPQCELGLRNYARVLRSIVGGGEYSIPTNQFTQALTILESARRLLVVLSADAPDDSVEGALRISRKYHGVLSVEDEVLNNLNISMQEVGGLAATLGELKDIETVFMCTPELNHTHSRLAEFLGTNAIVYSIVSTPSDSFQATRWLRLALADEKLEAPEKYRKIIDAMRIASTGVVFIDSSFLQAGEPTEREFLLWLRDLNRCGRWYGQYLPSGANSVGVAETLLSTGGIADGLFSGEDFEEISPRCWKASKLIKNGWMDACLFVGNPHTLVENLAAHLQGVKTILVDPMPPSWKSAVWLPAAQAGVDAAGSMARLDGVPLLLEQFVESGRPSIQMLLDGLLEGRVPS